MDAFWTYISGSQVHPAAVVLPYAILPAVGFPVVPFLVLLGLRFGSVWGLVIMLAVMPLHLAFSFWFTRSVAGRWIQTLAQKFNISIPHVPENRRLGFGFFFMVIPGLSYALKNYLLPLSGIRFFPYMVSAWLIQGIMGIPFVIMGRAVVQWDIKLLAVAGCILLAIFLFRRKILDIYRHIMKS
jgi:uncharacterized membrane protein YdjX (TVP38/TMEM64 family)